MAGDGSVPAVAGGSVALSFQQCVSRCTSNVISAAPQQPQSPTQNAAERIPQIDDNCFSDCTTSGYTYPFCKKQCTF